jgi:hypothetical protein
MFDFVLFLTVVILSLSVTKRIILPKVIIDPIKLADISSFLFGIQLFLLIIQILLFCDEIKL